MYNPPHPGEVLQDTVLERISVSEFARKLGVSRVALSRVANGRAAVSAASPSAAVSTSNPATSRRLPIVLRMAASSSTNRIRRFPMSAVSVARKEIPSQFSYYGVSSRCASTWSSTAACDAYSRASALKTSSESDVPSWSRMVRVLTGMATARNPARCIGGIV